MAVKSIAWKIIWKDAWDEYKSIRSQASAEEQVKELQKEIDALSKDAEITIAELMKDPYFK
jgi:hypothetical protein